VSHPRLSIVVVNWNTRALVARCLGSVRRTARDLGVEILVVDNASTDGSPELISEAFPEVCLLPQCENLGFARAVNAALRVATGTLVLLLNSDTLVPPGALARCVSALEEDPGVDVLGCRLVGEDGRVQSSCGLFPSLRTLWWQNAFSVVFRLLGPRPVRGLSRLTGIPVMPVKALVPLWDPHRSADVDWVSGAFLLTRREVFDRVGGMDEAFWLFGEDIDWCRRVRLSGGRVRYFGGAEVMHVGGGSTAERVESDLRHYRASVRLYRKHHGRFQAAVYRSVLAACAGFRLVGWVLARAAGRGSRQFRDRVAREWALIRL